MSDCEETDVFWESWSWTPGKEKRKKDSKKDKKCQKRKNNMTMKTDETIQRKKKKKNSKFKDAMEGRKEKKKEKKKNRLPLELDDSLIHTPAKPAEKPQTLKKHSVDKLKPDQDCKKKSRRKKELAFDLSPDIFSVKPPRCVSSSQQFPKKSVPSETAAVRDGERTGHSHGQTHANESQCNSEDINSQDMFITQKAFRASPSQPSSGESSDKAFSTTPPVFTPRDKLHTSTARKKQRPGGSDKRPQDSHFHQRHRTTKEHSRSSRQQSPSCVSHDTSAPPPMSTRSTSTQTENFFTTQLSSYFNFCQKTRATVHLEDLQPVDLSLPQRARRVKTFSSPGELKGRNPKEPNLHPSGSSHMEDTSVKEEPSSEDEPPCRSGMLDLTQVRAVQMRLNESFFFKTKGEGQSPRPESPLMKLVQGREVKRRKRH